MTNTFSSDWSPRNIWNFGLIRSGTLVEASPAQAPAAAETPDDAAGFRYWRRSLALVVDVLGRRFPDALNAVRDALIQARKDQSGPYAPDSETASGDPDPLPLPV